MQIINSNFQTYSYDGQEYSLLVINIYAKAGDPNTFWQSESNNYYTSAKAAIIDDYTQAVNPEDYIIENDFYYSPSSNQNDEQDHNRDENEEEEDIEIVYDDEDTVFEPNLKINNVDESLVNNDEIEDYQKQLLRAYNIATNKTENKSSNPKEKNHKKTIIIILAIIAIIISYIYLYFQYKK